MFFSGNSRNVYDIYCIRVPCEYDILSNRNTRIIKFVNFDVRKNEELPKLNISVIKYLSIELPTARINLKYRTSYIMQVLINIFSSKCNNMCFSFTNIYMSYFS